MTTEFLVIALPFRYRWHRLRAAQQSSAAALNRVGTPRTARGGNLNRAGNNPNRAWGMTRTSWGQRNREGVTRTGWGTT
ncbi:hypothetical protein NBRGN_041_00170 [Nocardia brasiliensis NBRC 14402]|nr:hypothetical protein NBRGN_041_00170 [Nocardia brasiliensis NBRC 14402]